MGQKPTAIGREDVAFGALLRELREGQSMTQDELARRADVSRATYAKVESGESTFSNEQTARVASVLGKKVSELYLELEDRN